MLLLLLLLLLRRHHALLLLPLHRHLRQMALLSKIGKVLLMYITLLLHTLLDQGCCALLRQLRVLVVAPAVAVGGSLSLGIISNRLLLVASSLCLDGDVGIVHALWSAGGWRHVVVGLDIGGHRGRLADGLRGRVPWQMGDLEGR